MTEPQFEIIPDITIPPELVSQIQSKLAYVDESIAGAKVTELGDSILVNVKKKDDLSRKAEIEEKIQRVIKDMGAGSGGPTIEIVEDHLKQTLPYSGNPMDELLDRGEVSQEGVGIFAFGPLMTRLIHYFESRFHELAEHLGATPYRFPALMSAEQLARVGYFRAFPHSLTFATHLREDLDVIADFAATTEYKEGGLTVEMDKFSKVEAVLSPAVCNHLYFSLADKQLPGGSLVATATGHCFRYESNNLTSLERLWNFTMQEIIFVGDRDFVLGKREESRDFMRAIFEDLGLSYHVETANDPFFVGEFKKQAAFQNAFQLKYEIRGALPFQNGSLAVGSYNYHQDFFGRHLAIGLPDDKFAHTGCTAFGLERFAYAFLAQYGFETASWPDAVRNALATK